MMKILFVSRGSHESEIKNVVRNQYKSLAKNNVDIEYFLILGKGLTGYLYSIFRLRKFIQKNDFDDSQ